MKTLKNALLLTALVICSIAANAQKNQKKEKELAKIDAIKEAIEHKRFVFIPEYARSDNGKDILVNDESYRSKNDYLIFKDGIITSYLPQVRRGALVTSATTSKINEIQFQSQKYELTTTEKKGRYTLVIKLLDSRDVRELIMDITPDGKYSTIRLLYYRYEATNLTGRIKPLGNDMPGNDTGE